MQKKSEFETERRYNVIEKKKCGDYVKTVTFFSFLKEIFDEKEKNN